MLTKDRKQILEAMRCAMADCGYDLDEVMGAQERTRILGDLRAIVWTLYGEVTDATYQQIGDAFGKNRVTVYSGVNRARCLRITDRNFSELYESLHSAFTAALNKSDNDNISNNNTIQTTNTMAKFKHNGRPIGITSVYDKNDPRLKKSVDICIAYSGTGLMKNKVCHRTVSVTEAEKAVIESIAMRLFLDHKKVIVKEETPDGKVKLTGVIAVDMITK